MGRTTVVVDKFFWGLGDANTRLWVGQFPFSQWIDFRRDPDFIQLSRAYEENFTTGNDLMLCAIDELQYSHSFYLGQSWQVYYDNWTNVYTLPSWADILNSIKFWDQYIFLYRIWGVGYIAAIDVANAGGAAWNPGDVDTDYGIYPWAHYEASEHMMMLNDSDDFLYIVMGKEIIRLDASGVISDGLKLEDDITGFTRHGGLYRAYTRHGLLYAWDGFSLEHEWYVNLNTYVRYVFNNSWVDYVFWGTIGQYWSLYYAQGFGKELLKKSRIIDDGKELYMYGLDHVWSNYTATEYNWMVFTPSEGNRWGIESIGREYVGYPTSFWIDQLIKDCDGIGMMYKRNRGIHTYFSYRDSVSWECRVARINQWISTSYKHVLSGNLHTPKYNLWHNDIKQLFELEMRADIPTDTAITLQYSLDGGAWQPAAYNPLTNWRFQIHGDAINADFYEIQFNLSLSTTNDNVTPKFYEMRAKVQTVWS